MKLLTTLAVLVTLLLPTVPLLAAEGKDQKPARKLTCCEKAAAEKKECRNKCCVAAHRAGKSCEKCNPNKEDLALLKKEEKRAARK